MDAQAQFVRMIRKQPHCVPHEDSVWLRLFIRLRVYVDDRDIHYS